jgi:predicted nuclease of restriction endonuclease-like (RecB) superfamily
VTRKKTSIVRVATGYDAVLADVAALIDAGRLAAVRTSNAIMTATYWGVGRRIVEEEQHGATRAEYGEALISRLSQDLQARFGRGFSYVNLSQMRSFYLGYREILQTASGESGHGPAVRKLQTASEEFLGLDELARVAGRFPLPWSCYVRLQSVRNPEARRFYEGEALRGGWTVRQLDRQIGSQFYERTALSKNKAAMLRKGQQQTPNDVTTPEEEIKDPFFFEFLNLKDEYSESDLEAALITKLENFLLELGADFAFIGRQRRLRVGDAWYKIDLLFFHRRLRCLVIIDLKLARRCGPDAPLPELRTRALDGRRREPAGRVDPVRREGQRRGALRDRRVAEQGAGRRVPHCVAEGTSLGRGDREDDPCHRDAPRGEAEDGRDKAKGPSSQEMISRLGSQMHG